MKCAEPSKIKIVPSFKEIIKASFSHFLFFLLLLGCTKEEPVYPDLELVRQGLSSSWAYQDTMYLNFTASQADRYQLRLLRGSEVLNLRQRLLFKEGNRYELEVIWDDPYLPSGAYDLRLQAFNGEEGVSTFFPINYTGLPLLQNGFALLGNTKVTLTDLNQNSIDYPINQSYDQIMVSSRDSLVYLAAFADTKLAIHRLNDFNLISELPLPAPQGSVSYQDFVKTEQGLFLLQRDGDIKYLEGGQIQAAYNVANGQGESARTGAWLGANLAAVVADNSGANPRLSIFNTNLNAELATYPLNDPNAYLVRLALDRVGVFQRIGGQLEFSSYDLLSNTFNLEFSAGIDAVKEAALTETTGGIELLIFATESDLYYYALNTFGPPQMDLSGNYLNFRLARPNNELFLQNGNAVQNYGSPGNLIFGTNFLGSLQDFDILYNK